MPITRKLRVFLCHASQDKPVVRDLYARLVVEDWINPWLDEEKLLPGQDWDSEIKKALETADVVIACLSKKSIRKEGYVQKELKAAIDSALTKPEGTIFIVPLRLDNCSLPWPLHSLQYVDYFPNSQREQSYNRLLTALEKRLGSNAIPQTRERYHHRADVPKTTASKVSTGKKSRSVVSKNKDLGLYSTSIENRAWIKGRTVKRPPRVITPLPKGAVELPVPLDPPAKPSMMNLPSLIFLALTIIIGIAFVIEVSIIKTSGIIYLLFMPFVVLSFIASILFYLIPKRKYKDELVRIREQYHHALEQTETQLQNLNKHQWNVLWEINPDLQECIRRLQTCDYRVGERRPEHEDFLTPRLGTGRSNSSYTIIDSSPKTRLPGMDREYDLAMRLKTEYSTLGNVPLCARLAHTGSIGIVGSMSNVHSSVRAIITHLVTHHVYSDLKIIPFSYDAHLYNEWKWMSNLPHCNTPLINYQRFIGESNWDEGSKRFLDQLQSILLARKEFMEQNKVSISGGSSFALENFVQLIIVFDHLPIKLNHPAIALLSQKDLGVYGVFLTDEIRDIPGWCGAIIHINDNCLVYQETGKDGVSFECYPDKSNINMSEAVVYNLRIRTWEED